MLGLFTEDSLMRLILTLPGLLFAITFHEFAHAFAADKLGDDTPRRQGRLTLNPLAHLDPVGSILLLFAGFGWGKPVQVNPRKFKGTMSCGEAIVSIAGPLMNFFLAIIFLIAYYMLLRFGTGLEGNVYIVIASMLFYGGAINIGLGVFNLIPLPPLDGSKILMHFLPYNARQWFIENEKIFYMAFIIMFVTGISSYIISPIISGIFSTLLKFIGMFFGV